MGPIRILIADDHAIIRRGLRTLLEREPGLEVIAEACDGREAIALARRERPHVVILDIAMPNLNGIEAGRQIAEMLPDTQIVILTVQADEAYLLSALKAGARGYVLKSSAESEVVDAVRAVSSREGVFQPQGQPHSGRRLHTVPAARAGYRRLRSAHQPRARNPATAG